MKNTLINNFNIWQRGDSFAGGGGAADGIFSADRWILLSDGPVVDIDKEATDVPQGSVNALKATVVTINTKYGFLQIIEQQNCQQLIGGAASLSFKAKSKGVKNMRAAVLSFTGTTADTIPNRDVVSAWKAEGTNPVLIADWAYENGPLNLELTPVYQTYKIENIQISSEAKNLAAFIWVDDMSDGTAGDEFLIGQVQLEKGSVATDFWYRSVGEELALCQRYYERLGGDVAEDIYFQWMAATGAAVFTFATLVYKVQKRAVPTVSKVGVWAVANCAQPGVGGAGRTTCNINSYSSAPGQFSFKTVNATTYIEIEKEL